MMYFSRETVILVVFLLTVAENGADEDTVKYMPKNLCIRLTTNTTALIQWVEPVTVRAEIMGYIIYYTRDPELPLSEWKSLTLGNNPMVQISNIELGQVYSFRVQINTLGLEGPGPISDLYNFRMLNRTRSCYDHPKTSTIKSLNVLRAAATSYSSVEVWWNFLYDPHYVIGFRIFYGTTDSNNNWQNKTVGLTQSAELTNLKKYAIYRITLAAVTESGLEFYPQETSVKVDPEEIPLDLKTYDIGADSITLEWSPPIRLNPLKYKISYDAVKDFVDSAGIKQHLQIERVEIIVDGHMEYYHLTNLMLYTSYNINISAIPIDYSYRPSARITAKTEIAAPAPMSKPEIFQIVNGGNVHVLLPKASEEHGPISYYYVVVIPESKGEADLPSSVYPTEELLENEWEEGEDVNAPYVAAKFSSKIPYAFILGTGDTTGFKNHKLNHDKKYRVFVRAVVITPSGYLFTDSPFSDYFSTDDIAATTLKPRTRFYK